MATWNTRGLRGSTLEDMVNRTNEKYAEAGLALRLGASVRDIASTIHAHPTLAEGLYEAALSLVEAG